MKRCCSYLFAFSLICFLPASVVAEQPEPLGAATSISIESLSSSELELVGGLHRNELEVLVTQYCNVALGIACNGSATWYGEWLCWPNDKGENGDYICRCGGGGGNGNPVNVYNGVTTTQEEAEKLCADDCREILEGPHPPAEANPNVGKVSKENCKSIAKAYITPPRPDLAEEEGLDCPEPPCELHSAQSGVDIEGTLCCRPMVELTCRPGKKECRRQN